MSFTSGRQASNLFSYIGFLSYYSENFRQVNGHPTWVSVFSGFTMIFTFNLIKKPDGFKQFYIHLWKRVGLAG